MIQTICSSTPDEAAAALLEARINALPRGVASMRDKLLEAAQEQDLNTLRAAIERNEVMPLFGAPGHRPRRFSQAIDFLKSWSFDGQGREVFLLLTTILNAPYARQIRKPVDMYIWPAQAVDATLAKATPVCDLYRFVAFSDLAALGSKGLPPMHRIEIGADGTWHFFAVK